MNSDGPVFGPPLLITLVSFCRYNDFYIIVDQHNELLYDLYMIFDQNIDFFDKENNLEIKVLQTSQKKAPAAAF